MKNKRGIFFSTDALIALIIIFMVIILIAPATKETLSKSKLNKDILESFSNLKVGDTANVPAYLITNPDNTVLEQIGEFYITNITSAKELTGIMLSNLEINKNLGIWYGNTLLYSINSTPFGNNKNIDTARQTITGIQNGSGVTGFSARAFLSNSQLNKYFYFGGYIGDGNITIIVDYNGTITAAEIEHTFDKSFELFVNNNNAGNFPAATSETTPTTINLDTTSLNSFIDGKNTVEFKGNSLHAAGGFIKITYDTEVQYQQPIQYNFPGIEGLINLYDGITIPTNLTDISVYLHMNSSLINTILNIGNTTVFNRTTIDEEIITMTKTDLEGYGLSLEELSSKTTPIRLGLEGSGLINVSLDVVSLTDKSNNMACSVICQNCHSNQNNCESAGGNWLTPLLNSTEANILLANELLQLLNTRVSVNGFKATVPSTEKLFLTNESGCLITGSDYGAECDSSSSQKGISEWDTQSLGSNSDLCDGIKKGIREELEARSTDPETIKIGIVQLTGSQDQCGATPPSGLDLNNNAILDELEDLNGINGVGDIGDKAIRLAWNLCVDLGVTLHTVGYGNQVDLDEETLQAIVADNGPCEGNYYYSDISGLVELYQDIIDDIIATYQLQTVTVSVGGGGSTSTKLYPDSYIQYTYDQPTIPFGLIITSEQQFTNSTSGNFSLPLNSTIVETKVSSYSGSKWTNTITFNNNVIYNLSEYGSDFITLGDPYSISIPNNLIQDNNNLYLTVASSPQNSSVGSSSNKIIYTIAKEVISFSPISGTAEGCIWHIDFEDGTNIIASAPNDYSGSENCFYQEGNIVEPDRNRDAFQTAVFNLLKQLDFNQNGRVDITFTEQDFQITITDLIGIPYTWSTEVQVRMWS